MKHAQRTDGLFISAAVIPALLMVTGYEDAAFIVFCLLLFVACIHLIYEQKTNQT